MKTGPSGAIAQRFLNSKLTPLLTAASLVLGIGAVMSTPREEEPQIRVPMIDVAVGFPGAESRHALPGCRWLSKLSTASLCCSSVRS